jgi:hypothetical protein
MTASPKWYGFVYRRLVQRPLRYFALGVVLAVLGLWGGTFEVRILLRAMGGQPTSAGDYLVLAASFGVCGLGVGGLALMAYAVRGAVTLLDRHPDVTDLARYGPPRQVVAAVDAEMADKKGVVAIRPVVRSFQLNSEYWTQAYLTPRWLIFERNKEGDELSIFRLEDVVVASRTDAPKVNVLARPLFPPAWVVLVDRHGFSVRLPFQNECAVRLLAEVLSRVPWVFAHFEPKVSADAGADLGRIVAEADRRRAETRVTEQRPPTSPS